jgi:alpha/beta superfamily hydrolase
MMFPPWRLPVILRRMAAFLSLLMVTPSVSLAMPAPLNERVVNLTASDGTDLKATYFSAGKPAPGVLLLHQCNRQRKVWDPLARQLSAAGINVLTFDYRGFGESGGEHIDKLTPQQAGRIMQEKFPGDIDTALTFLLSQSGVVRDVIGVGGASCGVNNSIQAAMRHPEVKSLVLLSGNTNLAGRNFMRSAATPPAFFAIADDDEFPPSIIAIEWLYSLDANSGKKLLHYAKGGHGADIFAVHPELMAEIVTWFVTTLVKTPGRAPASTVGSAIPKEVPILETLDQPGGAAIVEKELLALRQHDPKASLFSEQIVNFMGYEHLQAGDAKGAIAILKLNTVAYPDSPNTYDSLADGYLAEGQKDLALQSARRSLQLLPADTSDDKERREAIRESSEQKVKQLSAQP